MNWRRDFPCSPGGTARFYLGETLELGIFPPEELGLNRGELHLNRPDGTPGGLWERVPMEENRRGEFRLALSLDRPGLYRFRFCGWREGKSGHAASWDPVSYTALLVDPPSMEILKLYTFIPFASGPLAGWLEKLKVIRRLGFNGVHFLPFTQTGGSESPYAVGDHRRLDRSLLARGEEDGWDSLQGLTEECRKIGLKLCFDIVLNHVAVDGRLAREHPEWIFPDSEEPDGFRRAGCWHNEDWIRWDDLGKIWFNHPDPAIRHDIWNYFVEYAARWGALAEKTGGFLRLDNLHSSNPRFIHCLTAELSARYPGLALLAEYFDHPAILTNRVAPWRLNLLLANPWERPFVPELRQYLERLHEAEAPRHFIPISTHDTGVPSRLYGNLSSTIPRYFLGALMGSGHTGLVQGVEDGVEEKVPFIGYHQTMPPRQEGLFHEPIRAINALMDREPLVWRIGNLKFVDGGHHAILGALRRRPEEPGALFLAANLDIHGPQTLSLESLFRTLGEKPKRWIPLLPDTPMPEGENLILPPCGTAALRLEW